jgi:hypothetical protein
MKITGGIQFLIVFIKLNAIIWVFFPPLYGNYGIYTGNMGISIHVLFPN